METKNIFLYLPLLLALMLGTMGCSSDDDDIPDGWEKGPAGFFTLKINREMPVENASALLEAIIVTSPNVTSPVEKTLFCQGQNIEFEPTDIPKGDRKIGNIIKAQIVGYHQIVQPYGSIVIFCRIKK